MINYGQPSRFYVTVEAFPFFAGGDDGEVELREVGTSNFGCRFVCVFVVAFDGRTSLRFGGFCEVVGDFYCHVYPCFFEGFPGWFLGLLNRFFVNAVRCGTFVAQLFPFVV